MNGIKIFFLANLVVAIAIGVLWKFGHKILPSPSVPDLPDYWWGKVPKEAIEENYAITPFKISVSDEMLNDLKARLKNTKLSDPLEGPAFSYGFNTKYLNEVIAYWRNQYDWKKEEIRLNQIPGFKTRIQGIDVHYLHVKPKNVPSNKKIIPLLMIHGWPGSVVEFYHILPLLTTVVPERDFVFEVVCPHIPGYGFSEAPHKPGFGTVAAAQLFNKLMERLGFNKYYSQGGDWGSIITTNLGILYPERVFGIHITMLAGLSDTSIIKWVVGHWLPWLVVEDKDYAKLYPIQEKIKFIAKESGYFHLQASKPDTVGVALGDSPAGLAAYILEKFSTWTNKQNVDEHDGALTKKYSLDELLTNVMVYWVSGSITSSMRFYKESFMEMELNLDKIPVHVPTAIASFPQEILQLPQSFAEERFTNLIQFNDMPRGGHFAAWEEPKLLADDIWAFVTKVENLPKQSK